MQLRVIRELPFAKVGTLYTREEGGGITVSYGKLAVPICRVGCNLMVADKWMEEVGELQYKLERLFYQERGMYSSAKNWEKAIIQGIIEITTEHFKERETYDKGRSNS